MSSTNFISHLKLSYNSPSFSGQSGTPSQTCFMPIQWLMGPRGFASKWFQETPGVYQGVLVSLTGGDPLQRYWVNSQLLWQSFSSSPFEQSGTPSQAHARWKCKDRYKVPGGWNNFEIYIFHLLIFWKEPVVTSNFDAMFWKVFLPMKNS